MTYPEHKLKEQTFKLVSWPSPQDYQESIQVPVHNIGDQELKEGSVEQNSLGLPRPRTGFFATVYKMDCGTSSWAVRCFLNNIHDQKQRYCELSRYVMSDKLDCTVGFHYLEQGIKVRGDWYPILKMEWVEGETLGEYLSNKVQDFESMRRLAVDFEGMMAQLKESSIAHGDLQHGNIIVSQRGLRLVDYDGMFVPALDGWQSNEIGHRNYQHPGRNAQHFGPSLDNFSAWLIYCSLICLAIDPSLWDELDGGDECLLFRQDDFRDVGNSRAFSLMLYHPSPIVRDCAGWISKILEMPPDKVPYLLEVASRAQTLSPNQRKLAFSQRKRQPSSSSPQWAAEMYESGEALVKLSPQPPKVQVQNPYSLAHPGKTGKIFTNKAKARLVGIVMATCALVLYLSGLGAGISNKNSTMFPKNANERLPVLPSTLSDNEDGKLATWQLSPASAASDPRTRKYSVSWSDGATSEITVQAFKTGSSIQKVHAVRLDLTGESKGMTVDYSGVWDGSELSGVTNYKRNGLMRSGTFRAYPRMAELELKSRRQVRDQYKR